MKTPGTYTKLINQNKITKEIIGEVLYSINKRAKNWRDKKREYKNSYYDMSYENAIEEEEKYYKMKYDILQRFEPIKIHKDLKFRDTIIRIYEEDTIDVYGLTEYEGITYNQLNLKEKGYRIRKFGQFFNREYCEEVQFVDIIIGAELVNELYFKYYEVAEFNFHEPAKKQEVEKLKLEVEVLDNFKTFGKEIKELLSAQFCKRVYDKLINDELEIIE